MRKKEENRTSVMERKEDIAFLTYRNDHVKNVANKGEAITCKENNDFHHCASISLSSEIDRQGRT